LRPVILKEGKRAEHNPDRNRLTLQILFPKPNGSKAIMSQVILINGDEPQILIEAPEPVKVIIEEG
jgi:hypothetical protein